MDRNDILVLVTSMLMLVWLWQLWQLWESGRRQEYPVIRRRQLRPRTPKDCPYCCRSHASRCERVVREKRLPPPLFANDHFSSA